VVVETVVRGPNGKPDYRWARSIVDRTAAAAATPVEP